MRPTMGRFADQATLTGGFVDVSGRRVCLARAGQGPPLVYQHGAGDLGKSGPVLTLLADVRDLVFGCFCGVFQFGSLDHEHFLDSLQLLTRKVMPAIRGLGAWERDDR